MNLRAAYATLRPKAASAIAVVPLVVFRGAAGGVPVAIGLYIAHRWGLRELGAYTVANAFVAVALIVTDWGCTRSLPREIAVMERDRAASFVAEANAVRILLTIAVIAASAAAAAAHLIEADVAAYLLLLLPLCAVGMVSTNAVSERIVTGHLHGISVAVMLGIAVFLGLAVVGVRVAAGGPSLVLAYVISKCVEAAALVKGRRWVLAAAFREIGRVVMMLWPFSIQAILGVIYSRLAIFVIEHFGTRSAVGLVSAGSAIRSVLLLLPVSMALLSYPSLSVAARDHDIRRIREIIVVYLWICTIGVAAGLVLLVIFIHRVCSALHIPAADGGFIIAFVAAGITTIGTALAGVALQAFGGEHSAARLSFLTLGLAVLYYVVAVAYWGVWGTVVAMVFAELSAIVVFGYATIREGASRFKRGPQSIGDVL